jgi:hypothetical protein
MELAQQIDAICNRFEAAWRTGTQPRIEEYLPGDESARLAVLRELIGLEVYYRLRKSEQPQIEEYQTRFPWLGRDALVEAFRAASESSSEQAGGLDRLGQTWPPLPVTPFASPGLTPARSALPENLPHDFGRYRLLQLLGQGGMGFIYLAEDTQLGRQVALKIPRFDRDDDARQIERFQREARIAASLHHPNLCPVFDVGEINGIHFLTMPFLSGESLAARLRREGRLPPETAARFAARIARAMHTAHVAGILHRDLKPANVMISERGEPIVLDFGLARRTTAGDPRLTATAVFLGTPAYAPPEQISSDSQTLGPTCDVYSLGALLYEMLTGRPPFQGHAHEILRQVLTCDPEPPSRLAPDLAPGLEAICLKALAKEPAARFASMEAFAAALEGEWTIDKAPIAKASQGASNSASTAKMPRLARRRLSLALGLLAGAALLLLIVLGLLGRGRTTDAVQPQTRWSGPIEWLPNLTIGGEVTVIIRGRDGETFQGSYQAIHNNERYEWLIEGTVRGDAIAWRFTQIVEETHPTGVVENAHVAGTLRGDMMDVLYRDADSAAQLNLRLQK